MNKKNLLLDTNVLINNPRVFYDFKDKNVDGIFVSDITIAELDNIKNESGEKGKKAREAINEIVALIDKNGEINDEQTFGIIESPNDKELIELKKFPKTMNNDDRIVATLLICNRELDNKTIFLTFDNIAYIKAKRIIRKFVLNADVELFDVEKTNKTVSDDYLGRIEVYASEETMKSFRNNGEINISDCFTYDEQSTQLGALIKESVVENEFVCINNFEKSSSLLGRVSGNKIVKLEYSREHPYGVSPKNLAQIYFQEALMQDVEHAPLVICKGPAGTAKTFYSIAVGLEKLINHSKEEREYTKILCCRPNVQMDEDIGFLPGDEQEKIGPYFRPIIDNLEALISEKSNYQVEDLINFGNINFEAVAFMRGRSIVNTYLIVDEAQNLTITQVKGIITRAGKGTKIILIGDPDQIDNPYLDKYNNGLSYASNRMKGSKYCWQLTMNEREGVRSEIATEAAKRL